MSRGGGGDILFGFGCFCGVVLIGVVNMCLGVLFLDVTDLSTTPPAGVSDPDLLGVLVGGGVSPEVPTETSHQEEEFLKKVIALETLVISFIPFLGSAADVATCGLACALLTSRAGLVFKYLPERFRPQIFVKPFTYRWQKDVLYVVGLFFARVCLECTVCFVNATYGEGLGTVLVYAVLLVPGSLMIYNAVGWASHRAMKMCVSAWFGTVAAILFIGECFH